jgi:hypothetical protein
MAYVDVEHPGQLWALLLTPHSNKQLEKSCWLSNVGI